MRDVERIACLLFEQGRASPQQLRDAINSCLPEEDEECREERSLLEQTYPLMLAGIATLAMVLPVVRALQVVRRIVGFFQTFANALIARVPWLRRFFATETPVAQADQFATAASQLSPQYIQAVATTARILSRIGREVEVKGPTAFLLALVGIVASEFDIRAEVQNGEQTDDGA